MKVLKPVFLEKCEFQHQGKSFLVALFGIHSMGDDGTICSSRSLFELISFFF